MTKLSPKQKHAAVRSSFEAKINILWQWAKGGTPEGTVFPTTRSALRRWQDSDAGLIAWSDDAVDSLTGKNADLARQFKEIIEAFKKRSANSKSARLSDAESEVFALKAQVVSLTRQNAELMGRIVGLETAKRQLSDRLKALTSRSTGGI